MVDTPKLYDHDFNTWTQHTVALLRAHRFDELDLDALIEAVQDLGKSERNAIKSQLDRALMHLLKWRYQPERRTDSWLDSITDARTQIADKIEDSPSLRNYPQTLLATCYSRARRRAASQTGLALTTFPAACPFTIEEALDDEWLPQSEP
jgi:hypothetical protein